MNPRIRNLAIAALVPLVVFGFIFQIGDQAADPEKTRFVPRGIQTSPPLVAPSPIKPAVRSYRYALDLASLSGIPPDLEIGTPVEIWVTWSRGEHVAEPQRWITGATFQRILPATTPSGPDVAILAIPARQRQKMVWADTFASLTIFADDG